MHVGENVFERTIVIQKTGNVYKNMTRQMDKQKMEHVENNNKKQSKENERNCQTFCEFWNLDGKFAVVAFTTNIFGTLHMQMNTTKRNQHILYNHDSKHTWRHHFRQTIQIHDDIKQLDMNKRQERNNKS